MKKEKSIFNLKVNNVQSFQKSSVLCFGITKKRAAFTLAEVLITLSILGVIAAVTIPSIYANYEKRMTITRLKIAYSILDNMTRVSLAENKFPPLNKSTGNDLNIYNNYFFKYLNIAKDCTSGSGNCFKDNTFTTLDDSEISDNPGYKAGSYKKVLLENGMSVGVTGTVSAYHGYRFVVDIDGPNKGDSKLGQDVFLFSYVSPAIDGNKCKYAGLLPGSFDARKNGCNITRAKILKKCTENDFDGTDAPVYPNGSGCSGLIILDGWKISDDYPWGYAHKK